jgi:hypothetical protein
MYPRLTKFLNGEALMRPLKINNNELNFDFAAALKPSNSPH